MNNLKKYSELILEYRSYLEFFITRDELSRVEGGEIITISHGIEGEESIKIARKGVVGHATIYLCPKKIYFLSNNGTLRLDGNITLKIDDTMEHILTLENFIDTLKSKFKGKFEKKDKKVIAISEVEFRSLIKGQIITNTDLTIKLEQFNKGGDKVDILLTKSDMAKIIHNDVVEKDDAYVSMQKVSMSKIIKWAKEEKYKI